MKPCDIQYLPVPARGVEETGPRNLADELAALIELKERMAAEGWDFAGTQEVLVFRRAAAADPTQDRPTAGRPATAPTGDAASHPSLRQFRLVRDSRASGPQDRMSEPPAVPERTVGPEPCAQKLRTRAAMVAAPEAAPAQIPGQASDQAPGHEPGQPLRRFSIRKLATA